MDGFLQIPATLGLTYVVVLFWRMHSALRGTTLRSAWMWTIPGLTLWLVAWAGSILTPTVAGPAVDHLWYAVAVMMLCPPIAVLGARRPGSRVWGWFVLLPMLLVLGVPLFGGWNRGLEPSALSLQAPALVGYGLVLVMGTGNYLGTRLTGAALIYAVALLMLVAPLSVPAPAMLSDPHRSRLWATLVLSASVVWGARQAGRSVPARSRFDRLWLDFLDSFGIVWARRVQDRLNRAARNEGWPVRLELFGFVGTRSGSEASVATDTQARIERNLRWLLKRFVDPEWIDRRLAAEECDDGPPRQPAPGRQATSARPRESSIEG